MTISENRDELSQPASVSTMLLLGRWRNPMGFFGASLLATQTADDKLKVQQLIGYAVRVALHDAFDEMLPNQMVILLRELEAIQSQNGEIIGDETVSASMGIQQ